MTKYSNNCIQNCFDKQLFCLRRITDWERRMTLVKHVFYKEEVLRSATEDPTRTAYRWVDKEHAAKHVSGGSVDIVGGENAV